MFTSSFGCFIDLYKLPRSQLLLLEWKSVIIRILIQTYLGLSV